MRKKWFFIVLLSIAVLALAGTAAWFSIFGISKLFSAAGIGVTILAAAIEFGKIVTVSYVYQYWKTIRKFFRGFYIFGVIVVMSLTSIGVYGYLTGAYQISANKLETRDSQIKILENKKSVFVAQLDRINKSIQSSSDRINTLSGLRNQQEKRLDNLYNQKYLNVAKRTETQINSSDEQIRILNDDVTAKMKQTSSVNDSIAFYDQAIIEMKNSDISNEIGPYKFISDLTGIPMNKVVNIVALMIVLVFDPLAIALLIGVNQLTMDKAEDEKKKEKKKKKTESNPVQEENEEIKTENQDESNPVQEENEEIKTENQEDLWKEFMKPESNESVVDQSILQVQEQKPLTIQMPVVEINIPETIEEEPEYEESLIKESLIEEIAKEPVNAKEPVKEEPPVQNFEEPIETVVEEPAQIEQPVQTFIDEPRVLDLTPDVKPENIDSEFEPKKIASVTSRINVAHFIPKK
jgi:hypothetical protein